MLMAKCYLQRLLGLDAFILMFIISFIISHFIHLVGISIYILYVADLANLQ